MKTDFTALIRTESAVLRALHENVHLTFRSRESGRSARDAWSRACHALHTHVSALEPHLRQALEDAQYSNAQQIEFVVCFLEVDPLFFRSGYLKEALLTRIKRSELSAHITRRLRAVLVDAVRRRGSREFKYYCRLAARIADDGLRTQLAIFAAEGTSACASRARRMLACIAQHDTLLGGRSNNTVAGTP